MTLKSICYFFFTMFMLWANTLHAGNKIDPPGNNAIRCNGDALTAEECEIDRKDALAEGCINQQELNTIISYNGCPVCKKGKYKGWCPVGCFVRGTKIFVIDTTTGEQVWKPIEEVAALTSRYRVLAVAPDATLSSLSYSEFAIRFSTVGPESEPLVSIKTKNGVALGLTSTHAVVLANGNVVASETLQVGDELIDSNGFVDPIVEITRPTTDDDVFNIAVETDAIQSHLILAGGLLVGDQFLQGSNFLNSTLLQP